MSEILFANMHKMDLPSIHKAHACIRVQAEREKMDTATTET